MQLDSNHLRDPSPRILIVDDSSPMRSATRALICAAIVPCTCVEATSGEHAVALAEETRPAVVVMDLMMPGMNGIEATRKIKAMLRQTQIVVVSLHEAPKFQTESAQAGAAAFIPKCAMHRELIPLIRSLLEREGFPTRTADRQDSGEHA